MFDRAAVPQGCLLHFVDFMSLADIALVGPDPTLTSWEGLYEIFQFLLVDANDDDVAAGCEEEGGYLVPDTARASGLFRRSQLEVAQRNHEQHTHNHDCVPFHCLLGDLHQQVGGMDIFEHVLMCEEN